MWCIWEYFYLLHFRRRAQNVVNGEETRKVCRRCREIGWMDINHAIYYSTSSNSAEQHTIDVPVPHCNGSYRMITASSMPNLGTVRGVHANGCHSVLIGGLPIDVSVRPRCTSTNVHRWSGPGMRPYWWRSMAVCLCHMQHSTKMFV